MKKLITSLILLSSSASYAHGHQYWALSMIISGVVGHAISRAQEPPTQVIVQQLPIPPVGYHYIAVLDPECDCFKKVLVKNYE